LINCRFIIIDYKYGLRTEGRLKHEFKQQLDRSIE